MVAVPNRNRQAERRETTRREILGAAWEVAREDGLGALTLRAVAARVGMQPPSLYSHFASKNAIYDAMFEQAWAQFLDLAITTEQHLPKAPRPALKAIAQCFFDFAVSDLARYQLMNLRILPDFQPSGAAYQPAVQTLDRLGVLLRGLGVREDAGADLFTALMSGLADQQLANDPGGERWRRLLPRAIDMYADEMGLPGPRDRSTR